MTVDPAIYIVLPMILNLWWTAFLFWKCSFLETYSAIITATFWKWYLFWWILLPYTWYNEKYGINNTENQNTENQNTENQNI